MTRRGSKLSEFKHIPVSGDGNCFFHSISKYLELDKINISHKN